MPVDDEKILLDALQSSKISDREKALLDGITVDCSPLAMFSEDSSRWAHMFTVKEGRKDRYHLLGTDGDELSITVRGYVASANLPDTNLRSHKVEKFMQRIKIVVPDHKMFNRSIEGRAKLYRYVEQRIASRRLEPLQTSNAGAHQAIEASAPLVTWHGYGGVHAKIPATVDASGAIAHTVGAGQYIYTEDNVVEYYERVSLGDGKYAMTEVEPGLVRVGQLVEISMFFRVITFKNKSPAFKSHLQSILILSRERAEVFAEARDSAIEEDRKAFRQNAVVIPRKRKFREVAVEEMPGEAVPDNQA